MLSRNPLSLVIVAIYLGALLYLFLSAPTEPHTIWVGVLYSLGIIVGMWAIWTLRSTSWKITPEVASGAVLIENGPFTYIRHPMYLAIILVGLGLLLNHFTLLRLVVLLVIVGDLLWKIHLEEDHLHKAFSRYREYIKKTYKLIPFVY